MNPALGVAALARTYPAQNTQGPRGGPPYNEQYGLTQQPQSQFGTAGIAPPPTSAYQHAPVAGGLPSPAAYGQPSVAPQMYQEQGVPPPYHAYQQNPPPKNDYQWQQPPVYQPYAPTHDLEGQQQMFANPEKLITEDLDVTIRHGFLRKVYGVLSVQLLITFGLASLFNFIPVLGDWLKVNTWLGFAAIGVAICLVLMARKHPWNVICLILLSAAFGISIAVTTVQLHTSSFVIAAGITAVVTISLSIFACQTRIDFTGCGVFVFVSMIILMVFGIVCIFVRNQITHIVYAALGALLFSFYLIYDTQQIVGGKHRKYQYSIDDYIFASLTLYMDIINLFLFILQLVSAGDR